MIGYATPNQSDITYDHDTQRASIPITLHHLDETTESTTLVVTPGQVELFHSQLSRAIELRERELGPE
ncbi:hypothetical protein [Streptomyces sp. NPDC046685]|uniref:hypothetical protein n=1 Tax=Streptomyces sp. NPDC046685 TaxID=3157202 RepID=UPI0033CB01B1